jgi:hypothetical protein
MSIKILPKGKVHVLDFAFIFYFALLHNILHCLVIKFVPSSLLNSSSLEINELLDLLRYGLILLNFHKLLLHLMNIFEDKLSIQKLKCFIETFYSQVWRFWMINNQRILAIVFNEMFSCFYVSYYHILLHYLLRSVPGLNRYIDWPSILVQLKANLFILKYFEFDPLSSMSESYLC